MKFNFNKTSKKINDVIILGSSGIISTNLQKRLKKNRISFEVIGKRKIDLRKKKSIKFLKKKITNNVVIFISAEAPVKNITMFKNNIKICNNVCDALIKKKIKSLIYISSDAVYSDVKKKITEKTPTRPTSLHGKMHLIREQILKKKFKDIICIIRPTLIYGPGDTHKGYGPNQFLSKAKNKHHISIFGNGEEKRDHIYIENVISIIIKCILNGGRGIVNAATGKTYSFRKIAILINKELKNKKKIKRKKRNGPMPHNGYRPFDIKLLKKEFKNLKILDIKKGLKMFIKNL